MKTNNITLTERITTPNFYSVIIGTEQLNGRRKDSHFSFINSELIKRGWTHKASFTIIDNPSFMYDTFKLIQKDENSVMFCFGGIGATPDDYTREVASKAFTNNIMHFNEEAKELILNQFEKDAYPYRINMAYLPKNAKLLKNVVNTVPGFYVDERFFFTPGFPSMSHSMVIEALDKFYKQNLIKEHRLTFTAYCSENEMISLMKKYSKLIDISSLPKIIDNKKLVVISLVSTNFNEVKNTYDVFIEYLNNKKIKYLKADIRE